MVNNYIPKRGDIVWLDFHPQIGKEQAGNRPSLVLSYDNYNKATGLGVFCPITSKIKGYPFEIEIKTDEVKGVILTDQIKSLDWKCRNVKYISKIDSTTFNKVMNKINKLIF